MQKTIQFVKISAAGNDFVMIDNRTGFMTKDISAIAQKLCNRKFSIGGDGLIMLEKSDKADFKMVYLNSDGSHAAMCGNGGRSIARFANLLGVAAKKMVFETDAGLVHAEILADTIKLQLYEPKDARLDFSVTVDKKDFGVSFINTGVPHAVVMTGDVEKTDVFNLGRAIRYHKEFAPAGTNVNFVQVKDEHTILVRTYERGVEDETLACGTGVTASAIISGLKGLVKVPVSCVTRGGDTLYVSYVINKGDFVSPVSNVYLEGPAVVAFKGEVVL